MGELDAECVRFMLDAARQSVHERREQKSDHAGDEKAGWGSALR